MAVRQQQQLTSQMLTGLWMCGVNEANVRGGACC
jgi:hypothetical protein